MDQTKPRYCQGLLCFEVIFCVECLSTLTFYCNSIDCALPRTRTTKIRTIYESESNSIYGRCFIVYCLQITHRITVIAQHHDEYQQLMFNKCKK